MSDRATAPRGLCSFVLDWLNGAAAPGRSRSDVRQRPARGWIIERLEGRTLLSTITVTNTNDAGRGTLRAAIAQADVDVTADTILFAPSVTGTIALLSALPDLSANINIAGPGSSDLTVARSSAAGTNFRIFNVPIGAVVSISGMTITGGLVSDPGSDGNASGGGIENSGTLSITDVTISDNTAGMSFGLGGVGGEGGGIENSGMLSISDATINANEAVFAASTPGFGGGGEGGFGGGINNTGSFSVIDTAFTGNTGDGSGGAILNSGNLSVTDSTFSHNRGGGFISPGGAIGNTGSATVNGSTFASNTSANGGGGINNNGTLSLNGSIFTGNNAYNNIGGGINNSGTMTISNTTFTGNSNQGGGGAIGNSGSLSVTSSTFADNSAISSDIFNGISDIPNPGDGGGIDNGGTLSITNTTFNGNSASNGNTDQGGSGGAIFNSGTLSVTQVTMADNSVSGDGSAGGGIAISAGSNIAVMSIDSIFDNPEGGNISGGSASNFQSLGHNLFSDNPGVPLDPTDLINLDPLLGPLAANGGPTQTMALLPGSPAIDAGDCCFRRDHRSTGNHQAPGERPRHRRLRVPRLHPHHCERSRPAHAGRLGLCRSLGRRCG